MALTRYCSGKEFTYQWNAERLGFDPWVRKSPGLKWQPTPVLLAENFMDRGAYNRLEVLNYAGIGHD